MSKAALPDDIGGRELEFISGCAASASLPNAVIALGRDEGRAVKLIRLAAAAAACSAADKPCCRCDSCAKIISGNSQDVIEVLPEDGKQSIGVERARRVREDAFIAPGELEFKVYILHLSEKMNAQSQNALLKILEEPPAFASFVLLCANEAALLPTVRSRCVLLKISEPANTKKKTGKRDKAALAAVNTVKALTGKKRGDILEIQNSLTSDRQEYKKYISYLCSAFRDMSAYKAGIEEMLFWLDREECMFYACSFSEAGIFGAYDIIVRTLEENDANIYLPLSQTRLLCGLWSAIHG